MFSSSIVIAFVYSLDLIAWFDEEELHRDKCHVLELSRMPVLTQRVMTPRYALA